jgi:hypothetical protein
MGLDIRLPLGLLFLVTGGMMAVYGLFTRGSASMRSRFPSISIWCGD